MTQDDLQKTSNIPPPYGRQVFEQLKAGGHWGGFFSYRQYQLLKQTDDPAVVMAMAEENGYRDLQTSMSAAELVDALLQQGSGVAERKEIWTQAMVLSGFNPFWTVMHVLLELWERRQRERKCLKQRRSYRCIMSTQDWDRKS